MSHARIINGVRRYYEKRLAEYGATPQGVDWNSAESQELRFRQLLKICGKASGFTINDYGCGYGALYTYMRSKGYRFTYFGFDISERMISKAREINKGQDFCRFEWSESLLPVSDFTVASGIFNVKMQTGVDEWEEYLLNTIERSSELSATGFAFNVLTKYSDPECMRPDLYYADPLFLFDYCKRNLSRYVSLIHDYPLYEFTILVRKQNGAH